MTYYLRLISIKIWTFSLSLNCHSSPCLYCSCICSLSLFFWSWHVPISNSISSIQLKMDSVIVPRGAYWIVQPHWSGTSLQANRTCPSLDSLYTRHPHPPPSPPPFPSLVQEGWTLEETPTGALTPPFTHTYKLSCLWLPMFHTTLVCYNSLFSLFFNCCLCVLFLFLPTPWIHFFRFTLIFGE